MDHGGQRFGGKGGYLKIIVSICLLCFLLKIIFLIPPTIPPKVWRKPHWGDAILALVDPFYTKRGGRPIAGEATPLSLAL